jgi:hypothetical protein
VTVQFVSLLPEETNLKIENEVPKRKGKAGNNKIAPKIQLQDITCPYSLVTYKGKLWCNHDPKKEEKTGRTGNKQNSASSDLVEYKLGL